ncbi:hypothetical protein ASE55_19755 [Chryseobacterium sp. Leaf201]|nr:hypothetical protein ASE55_19755 [Chryseobacterium sp. Leaf201]
MDEKTHHLIENFAHFYSRTIYLFINSKHFFDKEDSIEPLINDLNMTYQGAKLENFSFVDSKNNLYIQLSDIIIGLIGKFYNFINENNIETIKEKLENLNEISKETLRLFNTILEESERKNKSYIFLLISNDEIEKINFINNSI